MRSLRVASFVGALLLVASCASKLPRPAAAPQPPNAFFEVPYPPPPAKVELVPASPRRDAVWVDGQWLWEGQAWTWDPGGWLVPPPGARFSRWQLARESDGRLMFAPPAWHGADGKEIPAPPILAPPPNRPPPAKVSESVECATDARGSGAAAPRSETRE